MGLSIKDLYFHEAEYIDQQYEDICNISVCTLSRFSIDPRLHAFESRYATLQSRSVRFHNVVTLGSLERDTMTTT